MPDPIDTSAVQLCLIDELTTLLQAAQIPHWLFGGWVVDFLVGEITRTHEDIDLIIWRRDVPAFRQLLERHGYTGGDSPTGPELDARFFKQNQVIDVMFVHPQEDGDVYWSDWRLPPGALGARHGHVEKITCLIVSPEVLLECKEACLRQADDPADLAKHKHDAARLRSLLSGLTSATSASQRSTRSGGRPAPLQVECRRDRRCSRRLHRQPGPVAEEN